MSSRRIQVIGPDRRAVAGVGVVTGAALALSGLSPTGSLATDWLVLAIAGLAAVWAAASAPWWALSGAATIAAALAPPTLPLLIGVGVVGLTLAVGTARRSQPVVRAIASGATILVFSMMRELGWFGVNTLLSVVLVSAVAVMGLSRRSRRDRRIALIGAGAALTVVAIGGLGLMVAGASARPDLSEGSRSARQGLRQLKQGEFDTAQSSFSRAADAFDRADRDLGSFFAQPARLVPIVAQHHSAGAGLSETSATAMRTIADQLAEIDLNRFRIVDGRIDIEAVRSLEAPLDQLQVALDDLERGIVDADNGWLIGRISDELADVRAEIDDPRQLGETAARALKVAPSLLGADGERVYFVMFTTPAEARGQGGFMGNYAEMSIDAGMIELTGFGRHTDLSRGGERPRVLEHAPPDWLARYASSGFRYEPGGVVGRDPWSNISISPHFPSTATVVSELYGKSGGRPIDGVLSFDVYALEQLIGLVGPIERVDTPRPLTGRNTAEYLLIDQYDFVEEGNADRVDQLEVIAEETLHRLLTNSPDPMELGRAMAPMVQQRRVLGWFEDPDEEAFLVEIDMDGELLGDLDGRDGYAVSVVNDGASKLDTYLGRSVTLVPGVEHDRLHLSVSHDAPVATLPTYPVGNTSNVPRGWARLWITLYTNRLVDATRLDGEVIGIRYDIEAGLNAYSVIVEIEPGTTQELEFDFTSGTLGAPREIVVIPQPLVRPELWQFGDQEPIEVTEPVTLTFPPG